MQTQHWNKVLFCDYLKKNIEIKIIKFVNKNTYCYTLSMLILQSLNALQQGRPTKHILFSLSNNHRMDLR